MQLTDLNTTNFKKLGSQSFEFGPGLNLIAGENFQGKSTLLQAIEVALFGPSAIPGKAENIPTFGQSKWGLELGFVLHGLRHHIKRTGSTAKLSRHNADGSIDLVASGTSPVTKEVEKLLDLGAKDYSTFIQSKQGESSGILTFGATALNRKVEEYAGVELIEKIQNAAQLRATRLAARAEGVPTDEVISESKQAVDEAEHYAAQASSGLQDAQAELDLHGEFASDPVADSAPAMREQVHAASLLLSQLESAEEAVAPAQQRVDEARARLTGRSVQDPAELQAKLDNLQELGTQSRKDLEALRGDQNAYNVALTKLAKLREAAEKAETAVVSVVDLTVQDQALKAADKAEADLLAATAKCTEADGRVRNLRELASGAKCPTCGTPKGEHDPVKLEQELADAVATLEALREARVPLVQANLDATAKVEANTRQDNEAVRTLAAFEEAEAELNTYQANFDNMTKVDDSEIHDAEALLEQNRTAYATVKAELGQITERNKLFNTDSAALRSAEQALQVAQQKAADLDQKYAALPEPPTEDDITKAAAAYSAYVTGLSAWRTKRDSLGHALEQATAQLAHRNELHNIAVKAHKALLDKVAAAADDMAMAKKYDRLVRFLRDGRQGYMQQVWTTVLAVSSRLVRESSKSTITRVLNDDGQFLFEEDGVQVPTCAASGAQKAFIGTALRVGLSRTLYGSDSLLVFDEPTESCSEQFASALTATLAASAKQVLLITHREADQVLADHVINVGV